MAYRLNRQLTLEAPQRVPDGAGGFVEGWVALGTVWASVTARSGREAAGIGVPLSRMGHKIILRAAPAGSSARPGPEHRLRDGSRIFRILAVSEEDADGRYLVCNTQEETVA